MFDVCAGCERRGKAYEILDWCARCERIPARSGQVAFKQDRGRVSWRAAWLGGAALPGEDRPPLPEDFGGRCCARARAVQCSCVLHWICPSHGDRHLGSHD